MTAVVIHTVYPALDYLLLWCSGCEQDHNIVTRRSGPTHSTGVGATWDWNGDLENPTISPSILSNGTGTQRQCHSFVRDGVWEYLADCDHPLAGQHVPMVRGPHWPPVDRSGLYRIRCLNCDDECPDWLGFQTRERAQAVADQWQESLDPNEHKLVVEPEVNDGAR